MTRFELYKKCIRGGCTPEEALQVENWLKENPDAFETEMLREMMEMEPATMPAAVREKILAHFREKGLDVGEFAENGRVVEMGAVRSRRSILIRRMSAAVVILLALTGAWIYYTNGNRQVAAVWATIENNGNGIKRVTLPDSTQVWLNSFATIRYLISADRQAKRVVELKGEAYFKVRSGNGQAFMVRTDNIQTHVLGTEFNVEAYPDEEMVRICLQQGKVQVKCLDGKGVAVDMRFLAPGEAATYKKTSNRLSIARTVSEKPQAWIEEGLVLNDAALDDALLRIGRKYNSRIIFDPEQAGRYRHITAYYRDMNVEQVLKQLGFTCDFNCRKENIGNDSTVKVYKVFFSHERATRPGRRQQ